MFAYSRKPAFHFGWDWAAKLTTVGIIKPVYLRGFSRARIISTQFRHTEITAETDYRKPIKVYGNVELEAVTSELFLIEIYNKEDIKTLIFSGYSTSAPRDFQETEPNLTNFTFYLKSPRLWWPHNIGQPYLYNFQIYVKSMSG
jgi:beta-mannosidase